MEIKPIRTEADYEAVLRRIEALWGSAQGTPEGDELDVMATLVESYESDRYPVDLLNAIERMHPSQRPPRARSRRPGPLKVESAQVSGHIDHLPDKKQAWHFPAFHRLRG